VPDRRPRVPEKILVLQIRRLGDVLLTTPLLRALRHLFPQARLDFLSEAANHVVLADNPHLTRLWTYPVPGGPVRVLALARALSRERYDVSVDTLGDPRSAMIGFLAGARLRIGFDVRIPRRWAYHRVVRRDPSKYTVDRKLDLVRWLGEVPLDLRPEYRVPEAARAEAAGLWTKLGIEGRRVAALSPVSRKKEKRWDPRAFAAVADRLAGEGFAILLLWGPGEESQASAVAAAMRAEPVLGGAPPVPQLAAMLERASVLVGNDNGMKHLAVAVETPSVAVHTVSSARSWNPPGDPRHVAVETEGRASEAEMRAVVEATARVLEGSPASD
jgi:heptosyltransferase-3